MEQFERTYASTSGSVAEARRDVSRYLEERGFEVETVSSARLCVSELATNCVVHAYPNEPGTYTITVSGEGPAVLEARDHGSGGLTHDRFGIGMRIVESLTTDLDLRSDADGTRVRAVLAAAQTQHPAP